MKRSTRVFLDIAIPVALYSLIILVSQLAVVLVFTVVYYAAYAGAAADSAISGLDQFLADRNGLISCISTLLVVAVIFADTRIKRVKVKDYTLFSKPIGARNIIMSAIAGISFSVWIGTMLSMLPIPDKLMDKYAEVSSAMGDTTPVFIVTAILLAPLVEEMVFRGIIYKHLRICMPEYPAIILQAVIFAVLHEGSIVWMVYALVGGLLMGYIAMLTGSIRASIATHVAFNLVSFLPMGNTLYLVIAAVSPVLLILSVRDIYKQSVK